MSTSDSKQIANYLLATVQYEMGLTTGVLKAVPADKLDYRPDPASKTALGLLRHITLEDEWLLNGVASGSFSAPPDDGDGCGIHSPTDAAERYQERIPAAIQRVAALSSEELDREVDFLGLMKMRVVDFLSLMLRHSVHHRGQLSTYLRPMGGKVPGIYGPSADTK